MAKKTRVLANLSQARRDLIYVLLQRIGSVRVYILGPASVAIDSRSLSVFLAVWRGGAGHVTGSSNSKEDFNRGFSYIISS